jgi:hypothetical protein
MALWPVVAAVAVVLAARTAAAQPDKSDDRANALFELGRRLVAEGKIAAGCDKFRDSLALDPAIGTKLNLADCIEQLGRRADAWSMFAEAAAEAERVGDKRVKYARDRAAKLERALVAVTVQLTGEVPDGIRVAIAGKPVTPWNARVFGDPGVAIAVDVTAPGRSGFRTSITGTAGQTVVVAVPSLGVDRPPPPPPPRARTGRHGITLEADLGVAYIDYPEAPSQPVFNAVPAFAIPITVGYFVDPRVAIGARLTTSVFETDVLDNDNVVSHALFGASAQWFFTPRAFAGATAGVAIYADVFDGGVIRVDGGGELRVGAELYARRKVAVRATANGGVNLYPGGGVVTWFGLVVGVQLAYR